MTGARTKSKGVTHYYTYEGINLIKEEWNGNVMLFLYDADGSVIGMQYRNSSYASGLWDTYYYEKNLQGDIIAIYNASGTKLVNYAYDPWGRIISITYGNGNDVRNNASHVGNLNPLRYRGYYYDKDLDLYYLATRYYDPETCRFVTADDPAVLTATPMGLTDKNLYAYCDNNPVMRIDNGGEFWTAILIGAAIGMVAQYVSDVIENVKEGATGEDIFVARSSLRDYIAAGIGGAIAAIPGTGFIGSLATGAAGNIATDMLKGNISNAEDLLYSGLAGALANGFGYGVNKGLSKLKIKKINSMNRTCKKIYLTEKVFKNSRSYANANLHTFVDAPKYVINNYLGAFKNGVYSTTTSTAFLTAYGGIVN